MNQANKSTVQGSEMNQQPAADRRILYCNCTYARVIKPEVKKQVLAGLANSGAAFDAVPDLCEMAAQQDPALKRLAQGGPVDIVACFPRAVKWLFHAAEAPLPDEGVTIHNMRTQEAEAVLAAALQSSSVETTSVETTSAETTSVETPLGESSSAEEPTP